MSKYAKSFDFQRVTTAKPAASFVSVAVPASVAYDLERFQEVQKDILGRLGCPGCTSGLDIRFDVQREFLVSEDLNVQAVGY